MSKRLLTRLVSTAAVVLGAAAVVGGGGGSGVPMFVLLLPIGAVGLLVAFRRGRTVELAWSGRSSAGPVVLAERAPAGRPARGSVAAALARVEARELVMSPWFAIGLGFWLLIVVIMGVIWSNDLDRSWRSLAGLAPIVCHPFVGMAVVGAHRSRTRSRRDGCDELFDACPADGATRTLGHLATAWVGALVSVGFVVGLALLAKLLESNAYGPIGGDVLAAVLSCAVLGAGGVLLGVALGRWAPWTLVPFVSIVAIVMVDRLINRIGDPAWASDRMLGTFFTGPSVDAIFLDGAVWARVAWLAALAVLVGALGLLGWRRRGLVVGAAAGAVVVAVVAATVIVQPASTGEVRRIAALIDDPMGHSTCVAVRGDIQACAYREYASLARMAARQLGPVADAVPADSLGHAVFLTQFDGTANDLPAEIRAAVTLRQTRYLRLSFSAHEEAGWAARARLAAYVLRLPTEPRVNGTSTVVAGQARGVVVLWLMTRGLGPNTTARLLDEEPDDGQGLDATDRAAVWPGTCHDEVSVLQWAPRDLEAARAVAALPAAQVQSVVWAQWDRWTDPATTTDDFLAAVGLHPLGPPGFIEARRYAC
jgi:hypothetical protein